MRLSKWILPVGGVVALLLSGAGFGGGYLFAESRQPPPPAAVVLRPECISTPRPYRFLDNRDHILKTVQVCTVSVP